MILRYLAWAAWMGVNLHAVLFLLATLADVAGVVLVGQQALMYFGFTWVLNLLATAWLVTLSGHPPAWPRRGRT